MQASRLENKAIDLQIAHYVYDTNTPFYAVNHPEFQKIIQM